MDVNQELKFFGNSKKKNWGGGGSGEGGGGGEGGVVRGGRVGGSGWIVNEELKFL